MTEEMTTEFLSNEDKALLRRTILKKFPDDQAESFIRRCERSKLDPFSGQIHPTLRNTKVRQDGEVVWVPTLVSVTGIYGLIAVAVRTGEYDGCEIFWAGSEGKWLGEWLSTNYPVAAKAVVYHKHRSHPEVAIARWESFVQQTYSQQTKRWEVSDFWSRMPDFMIAKCAKAAALRAAFPDQLSGVFINEELGSHLELESGDNDAEKIAEAQRREEDVVIAGARFVEERGTRPSPEAAAEPAFEEDKIPKKPRFGEQLQQDFPLESKTPSAPHPQTKATPGSAANKSQEEEDDLDMGETQATQVGAGQASPAPPAPDPAWKNWVLKSFTNRRFAGKRLGDLSEMEISTLEAQWVPKIHAEWGKANEAQKADYPHVEAAIAYYAMVKPQDR